MDAYWGSEWTLLTATVGGNQSVRPTAPRVSGSHGFTIECGANGEAALDVRSDMRVALRVHTLAGREVWSDTRMYAKGHHTVPLPAVVSNGTYVVSGVSTKDGTQRVLKGVWQH